jgi:hypothetical protein
MEKNYKTMKKLTIIYGFICFSVLLGCDSAENSTANSATEEKVSANIVATVYGEFITEKDVELMKERIFSNADALPINESLNEKITQSLIASKAMSYLAKQVMSADDIQLIEAKAKFYVEELYVKAYLSQHAIPEPVTTTMVLEYYQNNPTLFGAKQAKVFETLSLNVSANEAERNLFLSQTDLLATVKDWQQYSVGNPEDIKLDYKKSVFREGLFDEALEAEVIRLNKDEVSNIIIIKGQPTLLRVTDVEDVSAKPLAQVSADIRKKLAPLQLKKAVRKATDEAMRQANVTLKANE